MKRTLAWLFCLVLALTLLASCGGGGGGSSGGGGGGHTLKKEDLVIMLGNSITRRTDWSAKLPNNTVQNMGVDGAKTGEMLSRMNAVLSRGPKVLCVMGGINDLVAHIPVSTVYANLEQIVLRAKAAGIYVIIQSTLMTGFQYPNAGTLNPQVRDELNPRLSALASREENVRYLELNSLLGDGHETRDEYLTSDHLHINDAAYNVWAAALERTFP